MCGILSNQSYFFFFLATFYFNFKEGATNHLINDVAKKWIKNADDRNNRCKKRHKR